jgi:hypothetical protein
MRVHANQIDVAETALQVPAQMSGVAGRLRR